jgi:hypothetical protein
VKTYEKIAETLECLADYVDSIEHEKQQKTASELNERISKIAGSYENRTGESFPDALRNKLAQLDQETLDHLLKVANNNSDSPEALGSPSEKLDGYPEPRSTKEAAAQAEDKFLDWIINE